MKKLMLLALMAVFTAPAFGATYYSTNVPTYYDQGPRVTSGPLQTTISYDPGIKGIGPEEHITITDPGIKGIGPKTVTTW